MTTGILSLDQMWVMTLRPFAMFHRVGVGQTTCNIPLMGFGYRRTYIEVRSDLCRPCPRCFPRRVTTRVAIGVGDGKEEE